MEAIREILGVCGIAFGLFFYTAGVFGLVRFPDIYMRIHASGKVSALGIFGFAFGVAFLIPSVMLKLLILCIFMFVTQPVSSHSISRAAYLLRNDKWQLQKDELHDKLPAVEHKDLTTKK
jgi:multicomponent Na+:H+ antiporter subunit G